MASVDANEQMRGQARATANLSRQRQHSKKGLLTPKQLERSKAASLVWDRTHMTKAEWRIVHTPRALVASSSVASVAEVADENVATMQDPRAPLVRIAAVSEQSIVVAAPMARCEQIWDQMTHMNERRVGRGVPSGR